MNDRPVTEKISLKHYTLDAFKEQINIEKQNSLTNNYKKGWINDGS